MEGNTSFVAGYVAGKLIDGLASQFYTQVIARWSKQRAEEFLYQLCCELQAELLDGGCSDKVDSMLRDMLEDDIKSEVLFDAYRRVSLSKSKKLGPRIIGLMTCKLILAGQTASDEEENVLLAAESMSDDELTAFARFIRNQKEYVLDVNHKDVKIDEHGLQMQWNREQIDLSWGGTDTSLAPLDLGECLGPWARKLKAYGIMADDVKERQWSVRVDTDRHIDEDGTVREVSWWIYVPRAYFCFADMIDRVSGGDTE
ncbi:hypothetical protein [Geomesophilobacter sediminis]|uniref:Uncharacterized protein n=1 Tax=Geomesophilobacter sediminis TaxID=2798584 RepID=A0A8J7M182_9BACT|nr:hypothetical protein [Geomesophilobacter sediminis]MBJ6726800.1 hypothetical protein [Geomesophilobacter sediminis]